MASVPEPGTHATEIRTRDHASVVVLDVPPFGTVTKTVHMMKRNIVWLVVIIVVGLAVWRAAGIVAGLIAAGVTLAISEIVERLARAKRRAANSST